MAATNLIAINVYKINSLPAIATSIAGYNPLMFPSTGIVVQPVGLSGTNPLSTGVYVYSSFTTSATGSTVFYSGLTPGAIQTLANA